MKTATAIEFPAGAERRDDAVVGPVLEWISLCGRYRAVRFVEPNFHVIRYLATRRCSFNNVPRWVRLTAERRGAVMHRKLSTAIAACQADARTGGPT